MIREIIGWFDKKFFDAKMRRKYGTNLKQADQDGKTPLMKATTAREATWLLEHGVNWDATDPQGNTVLWYANEEVTKAICDFVNQENHDNLDAFVKHQNSNKKTAYDHVKESLEKMKVTDDNMSSYSELCDKESYLADLCGIQNDNFGSKNSILSLRPSQRPDPSSYPQKVGRWSMWDGTNRPTTNGFLSHILTY